MEHFADCFAFAEARSAGIDTAAIRGMIPGCTQVSRASRSQDLKGIDYIAELESGVKLAIDAKARSAGCRKFWRRTRGGDREPDVHLETWSVIPGSAVPDDQPEGSIGWTLDSGKRTDLVLYTFDPADCDRCYLFGFQHLRAAFVRFRAEWMLEYHSARQHSCDNGREWRSECVFVPVTVVQRAIQSVSVGRPSVLLPAQAKAA